MFCVFMTLFKSGGFYIYEKEEVGGQSLSPHTSQVHCREKITGEEENAFR